VDLSGYMGPVISPSFFSSDEDVAPSLKMLDTPLRPRESSDVDCPAMGFSFQFFGVLVFGLKAVRLQSPPHSLRTCSEL